MRVQKGQFLQTYYMTSDRRICTPAIRYISVFYQLFSLRHCFHKTCVLPKNYPGEKEVREILDKQSDKFEKPVTISVEVDSTEDEQKPNPWTKSWNLNINGNQASYRNWSQGG